MTMTPRHLLPACTLALGVGAGVFTAQAWVAPAASEEAPALRRASNPNGALLQDLRRYRIRTARLEETPPQEVDVSDRTGSLPPSILAYAPLPPARPLELAMPTTGGPFAPLPPIRPKELGFASSATDSRAAAPMAVTAEPESVPAAAPITLASLLPSTATDQPASPLLQRDDGNFRLGAPAYVRIFKKEGELELWLKRNGRYSLYKTYPICKWSGHLGPKLQSGDYQSPEGFYSVSARQLNPNSAYHRAFNVGFPNAYDRQHGRTGGALMVHGACKSVGCFAMTDKVIEEIYGFVEAALHGGQHDVPVHIFPFRLTEAAIAKETKGDWTSLWAVSSNNQQWASFWENLKEGYDLFEQTGEPPTAYACGRRYAFGQAGASCTRIAGW